MRVKDWRNRMRRLEAEINGDKQITDESYVAANMARADLRVIGRTERERGHSTLTVQFEQFTSELAMLGLQIPAVGELMDAKPGDRLRIVFASDSDDYDAT